MDFGSSNTLGFKAAPHQTAGRHIFEFQRTLHFSGIEIIEQRVAQMHQPFGEKTLFRVVKIIRRKPAHLFSIDQLGRHFVVK